jgi:flagellum-specific ATP synthase
MSAQHIFLEALEGVPVAHRSGRVRRVAAGHVEATGPMAMLGELCEIGVGDDALLAEVVAVEENHVVLVPLDASRPIAPDARVVARASGARLPAGDRFAGRACDALGAPLDGGPDILASTHRSMAGRVLSPLERQDVKDVLETGLGALDTLLTIGRGQRIGIFAAAGVGKTTLIRQLALQLVADRCVLCLVGERGREVESLWREVSQSPQQKKFTCVAATSDVSAPLRARSVLQALAVAEYWREQGEHVVLILDSVTRYAMALREIGLASGAPPTLRAYTPNVFAALPRLVERCGAARSGGSITAVLTVLAETDDVEDPIVEVMKSLLDGHIVLSRSLAEQGHFPAIDITRSVSRAAPQLMHPAHAALARKANALLSTYDESKVMIDSGLYRSGANPNTDEAIRLREPLMNFLRQTSGERRSLPESLQRLGSAIGGGSQMR